MSGVGRWIFPDGNEASLKFQESITSENGPRTKGTEKAHISGLMENHTQEIGKMIRDMVSHAYSKSINLSGQGRAVYANDDIFEGEFECNKRKYGKYTFNNGTVDEALYQDDEKHGEGFRTMNGARRRAFFENDCFIKYLN